MRILVMLASCFLVAGCGDDGPGAPARLPRVSDVGGPKLTHPQLVPIFFSADPDVETLTNFSRWVVTSSWFDEVGAEYGIGTGSVLGVVHKPVPAPDAITDTQIVDLLYLGLADGSLPKAPAGGAGEVLYVFHFPSHTVVTSFDDKSCDVFSGYHGSARRNGVELAYAVVASCFDFSPSLTEVESRELITSHELIEAATDPFPSNQPGFRLRDPTSSWFALGGEVGDLCEGTKASIWREAGFVAQRSWSNAAAAAGDPCVPSPAGGRYYNVVADGGALPRIAPGSTKAIGLTGWSTSTTTDWMMSAVSAKDGDATLTLAASTLNAGKTTTLSITVPPTATKGTALRLFVFSAQSQTDFQVLPVLAIVDDPCSTFTRCETCASHGCGFCTTTGRCETVGASGSAESSCPASSFATWPGSCPGFCGGHSASCTECASQPGCGACTAGGVTKCLEASHDYSHPATSTCAYADWSFTPGYCPQ